MAKARMSLQGLFRTKAAVEAFERQRQPQRVQTGSGDAAPRHTNTIRVTSTTPTSGRYPGKLQFFDREAGTWSDGNDCWLVDVNAGTLTTRKYEPCTFRGYLTADGLATFTIDKGAGGGTDTTVAFSGAKVRSTTNITITTNTVMDYTSNRTLYWDTDSYFDSGSPTVLTAPAAGKYLAGYTVNFNQSGGATGFMDMTTDLDSVASSDFAIGSILYVDWDKATTARSMTGEGVIDLASGNTLRLLMSKNHVTGSGTIVTVSFAMWLVRLPGKPV